MPNKLFDLFEQWFGEQIGKKLKNSAADKINAATQNLDQLDSTIDSLNDTLIDHRDELEHLKDTYGANSAQVKAQRDKIKQLEKDLEEENKKKAKALKDLANQTNLSTDELQDYIDTIRAHGVDALRSSLATDTFRRSMSSFTQTLGFDLKALSLEFFTLTGIIAAATEQLVKSNQYIIDFSRKTGGVLNGRRLGFDNYGNNLTNTGSLSALTNINNISEDQFFESLGGFVKGNIIGQDYSKSASDLQRFGTEQARLMKIYGIGAGEITSITETTTQFYNVSIKQLNAELKFGAEIARRAGLNIQEYFKNLARAMELIGSVYIGGGTMGMEKLAMFATRFNTSVDVLTKFGEGYQTLSDIYEKQAIATNLGLQNYAGNAAKMFAQFQLGNIEGLSKTAISSLAKDLVKYTDKNGLIDNRGLKALNQLGLGQEEAKVIQRTIQAQRKLGVSFEELSDISKMTADKQLQYYQEMNKSATITEKLNTLWGIVKSTVLDPIASILGPALDLTINLLIFTFKTLYIFMKPVIAAFQAVGSSLSNMADKVAGVTGWLEEVFRNIGIKGETTSKVFDKLIKIGGALGAALLVLKATTYATAAAQSLGGKFGRIGNLISAIPGLGRIGSLVGRGGNLIGKISPSLIKGAGFALAGSLAGDAISSMGAEGGTADRLGSAVSLGVTGAQIGRFGGGWGMAIGAVVGALGGFFKEEISGLTEKIGAWFKKMLNSVSFLGPIFNTVTEFKNLYAKWFSNEENKNAKNFSVKSEFNDMNLNKIINDSLNQRTTESFKAEKAQEKLLQQIATPKVVIDNSNILGVLKTKSAGYG